MIGTHDEELLEILTSEEVRDVFSKEDAELAKTNAASVCAQIRKTHTKAKASAEAKSKKKKPEKRKPVSVESKSS